MPIPLFALEDIIYKLAQQRWNATGRGLPAFTIMDRAALMAALGQPFQTVGGERLYPTVIDQAACLFRGLVKDHGLVDGNKRLAVTTLGIFLLANGREPTYSDLQLLRYALRIARHHGDYPMPQIIAWIRRNSRQLDATRRAEVRDRNAGIYAMGDPIRAIFERPSSAAT